MLEVQDKCVSKSLQETVSVQLANKCDRCLIKIKVDHMIISEHLDLDTVLSMQVTKEGSDP